MSSTLPLLAQRAFVAKEARVPSAVQTGEARLVGPADRKQHFELAVALPVRNQAALTELLKELYDPNSANFHHFVTVGQFADTFGASPAEYKQVVSYLKAQGFTVTVEHQNRLAVSFRGDADTIERAFHVKMNEYQHPKENRTFYSPDREPTVTGLNVPLQLIAGLDNYVLPVAHNRHIDPAQGSGAFEDKVTSKVTVTCSSAPYKVNVGTGPCGTYIPSDLRTAYGVTSLTGAGQQIGIFGFNGACTTDVTNLASAMNVTLPNIVYKLGAVNTSCKSDAEQSLDIVMASGMAPGITQINFFSNKNNDLTILNAMASDTSSSVYSCSWGWTSKNYSAEDIDFQEMAAQGQTFLNATGDDGGYNTTTWVFPSGDPYIIQVGGTTLTTTTNGGPWSAETAWPYSSGGVPPASDVSGGYNYGVTYAQPSWQSGVANAQNGVSSTNRTDPDIAAEADFEYAYCQNSKCGDASAGTSYAAPLWAGIFAGLNTISVAATNSTIGFANPQLYAAGKSASFSNIFHDVVACGGLPGENEETGPKCTSSDEGSPVVGFNPVAGYDGTVGWGAPNGANLIGALTVPGLTLSSSSGTASSTITATLTYPDVSGPVNFYAKNAGGTVTQIGSCTLTSYTCTGTLTIPPAGTYTVYGVYSEVETYGYPSSGSPTTRTVNKTSNTKTLTITNNPVTFSSVSHNFGSLATGTSTSGANNYGVKVTNTSAVAVSFSVTLASPAGFTQNNNCGASLAAGANCEIIFGFAPTSAVAYSTTWSLTGTANGTTFSPSNGGTLSGTGVTSGALTLTTAKHNFGNQAVNSTSGVFGAVLTNSTSSSVTITVAAPTGNTTDFTTTLNNCGATLNAGASCNLQYTFNPKATGSFSEFIGVTGSVPVTAGGASATGLTLVGTGQ